MASDIGSYLTLGIVIIGGFVLIKYGPGWLASIQASAMQPGGGGLLGGGGGGTTDTTGGGGGLLGGGGGVDCSQTPNDPSCQLSGSSSNLGPGTTSKNQITRDILAIYNNNCGSKATISGMHYNCPGISSSFTKQMSVTYGSSYSQLSQLVRGSQQYMDLARIVAQDIAQRNCPSCAMIAFGVGPQTGPSGCVNSNALADNDYQGTVRKICTTNCSQGYMTCFLGHDNNLRRCAGCTCGSDSAAGVRAKFNAGCGGSTATSPDNRPCVCDCNISRQKCGPGNASCTACWLRQGTNNVPCNPHTACGSSICRSTCNQNPSGGTPTHGSGSGGHTTPSFSCSPSTGACSTSGQQTCFHICDRQKQKNCVRCDTSPPLVPPPSCASVKSHVTLSC